METIPLEFDIQLIGYLILSFATGFGIGHIWTASVKFMEKI